MLVGFSLMPRMDMVMGSVLVDVPMVVNALPRTMVMGVFVLVPVRVRMGMDMLVAMPSYPRMFVFMLVFVAMVVAVLMVVFMVAFHRNLHFCRKHRPFGALFPDGIFIFPMALAASRLCTHGRLRIRNG